MGNWRRRRPLEGVRFPWIRNRTWSAAGTPQKVKDKDQLRGRKPERGTGYEDIEGLEPLQELVLVGS